MPTKGPDYGDNPIGRARGRDENFHHKPQPVEFSSSPGGSTPANPVDPGVVEGTGQRAAEGIKGSLKDSPDADDFFR
jgi:hypothetical protein